MKLKKENKSFSVYNCMLDINTLSNEVNWKIIPKKRRTSFSNIHYFNWYYKWFPYKNLELTSWKNYICFVLI